MSHRPRRSRGFTQVDVVAAFCIVGIVLTLYVPAMSHAREQARASQCKNVLLNNSFAMQNYEEAFRSFANTPTVRAIEGR